MKRMISPSAAVISLRIAFMRSSNSPRYFVPASRLPTSSVRRRRRFRPSGTSPATMRRARPSTTAVLPTPGSPISTGLFFVRRERIWMTRRISSSRPTTGSILPARARARSGRSCTCRATAYLPSGVVSVTRWLPAHGLQRRHRPRPSWRRRAVSASNAAPDRSPRIPSSRCSVETYSSRWSFAAASASSITLRRRRERNGSAPPSARGSRSSSFGEDAGEALRRRRSGLREHGGHDAVALLDERERAGARACSSGWPAAAALCRGLPGGLPATSGSGGRASRGLAICDGPGASRGPSRLLGRCLR